VPPPVSPKNFNKSEFFVSDPIPRTKFRDPKMFITEGVPVNCPVSKRPFTSDPSHGLPSKSISAQPLIVIVPPLEKFQVVAVEPVKFPVLKSSVPDPKVPMPKMGTKTPECAGVPCPATPNTSMPVPTSGVEPPA
jgi:hypothetical protein